MRPKTSKVDRVNKRLKGLHESLKRMAAKHLPKPGFPKPNHCKNCGSVELEFCDDGASFGEDMKWVCEHCGCVHKPEGPGYNGKLDPEVQLDTEEMIAALIFEGVREDEGCDVFEQRAGDLSREIVKRVLSRFRPDLFEKTKR